MGLAESLEKGGAVMFFERDIWKSLVKWKNTSKLTLEVHEARQVGKTTVLKKFCEEEFDNFIYVNMAGQSGADFLCCIEKWHNKYFGTHTNRTWISELLKMYEPAFKDSEDTVVLIDEIQESSQVYNLTRDLTRDLKTKVIVTGSYLGKVLDKEFFIPAGDVYSVTVYTMSFPEFLGALGRRELQKEYYDKNANNEEMAFLLVVYLQTGGYPSVVREYLENEDIGECYDTLEQIVNNFVSESLRYFTTIEDVSVLTRVLGAIATLALKEKQGREDLAAEIGRLVEKDKIKISRKVVTKAIAWLRQSGIIGYSTKLINADPTSAAMSARIYFQDTGVANYFARLSGFDSGTRIGCLVENYAYVVMRNRFYPGGKTSHVVFGMEPMFSVCTSNGGELDFVLCGESGKRIGIEVKAGKNKANTGKAMLEESLIDQLFILKGNTECGETGSIVTLPLYFLDIIKFSFRE